MHMRYDLIASDDEILQASSGTGIKRTKSFWKFGAGRHDDILAGMSLWQHRDLVTAPNMEEMRDEGYRTTSSKMESEREMESNDIMANNSAPPTQEKDTRGEVHHRSRKDSVTSVEMYDEEENIYGLSPMVREPMITRNSNVNNNNFTPKSRMKIMKTIEIDIENPGETERLTTIKRNQKEFRDNNTMKRNSMMTNSSNSNKQNSLNNNNNRGGQVPTHKKSYDIPKIQQNKVMNGQQRNMPPKDMFPSTESEAGESELDNGTLKMSDVNNFFDSNGNSNGGIIMKTVKRKDILKQYYTSEDDSDEAEIKSTSSDPYDCIVINDHLVRRDENKRRGLHMQEQQMEFQTFRSSNSNNTMSKNQQHNLNNNTLNNSSNKKKSDRSNRMEEQERNRASSNSYDQQQQMQQQEQLRYNDTTSTLTRPSNSQLSTPTATILPRTRLMKSSNITSSLTLERNMNTSNSNQKSMNSERDKHYGKTYGPWYDFWDQQDQQQQQQQQQHQQHQQQNQSKNHKMKQ